jgi:hypothetical protein
VPLAFQRYLHPDLKCRTEEPFQFDDLDPVRNIWPIMVPTDDTVTGLGAMAMRLEITRPVLKLNPDLLFGLSGVTIGDTVREGGTDLLYAELQAFGDMSE